MSQRKASLREDATSWVDLYQRAVALQAVALRAGADGDTTTRRTLEREAAATFLVGLRVRGGPLASPTALMAGVSALRATSAWPAAAIHASRRKPSR